MPVTPTYPGVYIEEIPSGVRTISLVSPSITAFVGGTKRGVADYPVRIQSFADFQRQFGGLSPIHPMTYSVNHFFQNGGSEALILRVTAADAATATVDANGLPLRLISAGVWGNKVLVRVDHATRIPNDPKMFNLFAYDSESENVEEFRNVSTDPEDKRYVKSVLDAESVLLRIDVEAGGVPENKPGASGDVESGQWFDDANAGARSQASGGTDGAVLGKVTDLDLRGNNQPGRGIDALMKTNVYFSLMCIPPASFDAPNVEVETYAAALALVNEPTNHKRALVLVDAPSSWDSIQQASQGVEVMRGNLGNGLDKAALFFPRLMMNDPLREGRLGEYVPCGAIAGIMARVDLQRGIWKAPAGIEAGLRGVRRLTVEMNDKENGALNPKAVNCLRDFPAYGRVVWGSRTMQGFDEYGSEWKYIPVRRFALYLEENLYRGTQWVVFEPNDEPLWAQIRLNVGTFMQDLFRQGAFQGRSPQEAYFVRCDSTTTTQSDINRGIVNIEVGFAPLKPAEFVILKIQQIQKNP